VFYVVLLGIANFFYYVSMMHRYIHCIFIYFKSDHHDHYTPTKNIIIVYIVVLNHAIQTVTACL